MNRQRRFTAAVSALLLSGGLLGVAAPSVAMAAEHSPVTLSSMSDTASWSGEFTAGAFGVAPVVGLPEGCTPQLCDIVPLDVRLPEQTWRQRPGGMLVAIQSPVVEFLYDLDVFVYAPDGSLAASSAYGFANEAAWLPNPVNGHYIVKVVPRAGLGQPLIDDVMEPLSYDGFVRFDRGVTAQRTELNLGLPMKRGFVAFDRTETQPPVELLPDLVPTTPRNFHLETTAGVPPFFYAARAPRHQPSCYPEETLGLTADDPDPEVGSRRCLRFDQGEYNLGDGPFQLNVYEGSTDVYQRIYSSDGDVRQTPALGKVTFSELHSHFHFLGFQEVTLHRIEEDGSLTFIKEKPDKGICPGDAEMAWFGRTDQSTSPLAYIAGASFGPSSIGLAGQDQPAQINTENQQMICVWPSHQDPNDPDPDFRNKPYIEMGISVGWADVYPWYIADQYIDITDRTEVPDGDYALIVRQDVNGRILEKSTKNNTAMGCVRITGDLAQGIPCGTSR